ncbi:MAG: hypothetical protein ACTHL1_08975, partial [Burkholderiaceae bacterium]
VMTTSDHSIFSPTALIRCQTQIVFSLSDESRPGQQFKDYAAVRRITQADASLRVTSAQYDDTGAAQPGSG